MSWYANCIRYVMIVGAIIHSFRKAKNYPWFFFRIGVGYSTLYFLLFILIKQPSLNYLVLPTMISIIILTGTVLINFYELKSSTRLKLMALLGAPKWKFTQFVLVDNIIISLVSFNISYFVWIQIFRFSVITNGSADLLEQITTLDLIVGSLIITMLISIVPISHILVKALKPIVSNRDIR